jgi:hypothetical protein
MKQAAATAVIPTAPSGRTIGEILLSRSLVTDAELDDAIAIQRDTGKPLGQVLVEAGTITRLELASALAEQWGDVGTISPTFPGGSAYIDPAELDGNPSTQLEELHRTRRALEERMLAFERNAEDAQWQQEIAAGIRALFGRVDVLEASLGEFTESGLINELRQLVVELAQRTETMAPELETLRARIDGSASVAALQYGLSEIAERIEESDARSEALEGRLDEIAAGLASAIDELRRASQAAGQAHEDLASRVDSAASAGAIDPLRASVDELRETVAELAQRPSVDPVLNARLDAMAADVAGRVDHATVAALAAELAELGRRSSGEPVLAGRLDELATRVEELGERLELGTGVPSGDGEPDARVDALIARVAELAAHQAADAGLGERIATADERIDALAAELAGRPVGHPVLEARLDEAAARIDALAAALAERPQGNPALEAKLTETAHRVDAVAAELAGRADAAGQAELSRLVAELAERPDSDPALAARVQELHSRLDELTARPLTDPELAARIEELAAQLEAATHAQAETAADPRVDALQSTVTALAARLEALGEPPAGEAVPADLEQRLAAAIHLSQSLTDQLHRATSSWDEAQRALEARIEWIAARMEADAPAPVVSAPEEGRSGKRRGGSSDGDADVERLRMAVERLMLDFADHRRAISAAAPARDLDERVRRLAEQVDELSGSVGVSGNGGASAPARGGGSIDRELANQVKAVMSRLEEVEASSAAGRDTLLARLERIMGTIDWRLQRLENPGS